MSILNNNGYILNKKKYSKEKLNKIKDKLTVHPSNSYMADLQIFEQPKFKVYKEDNDSLYLPKYFGIDNFGKPEKNLISGGKTSDMKFLTNLKDYQLPCVNKIISTCKESGGGLLCVPCGFGKCLGINTPILMYDGSIKMVQDVLPNDKIMGDNCKPRNVLSICSGKETMYEISQTIGSNYIVNESHILTVYIDNKLIDIPLKDCFELQKTKKIVGCHKQVEFEKKYNIEDRTLWKYIVDSKVKGKIPHRYKCASIETRRRFLHIFMEYYGDENKVMIECPIFKIDIIYLFSSVGIKISIDNTSKHCTWIKVHNNNNSCEIINNITITKLKEDSYYGFEIDGNKRFLLGDCTVTHNTVVSLYIACALKSKTLVIVHKEFLVNQWKERIEQFTDAKIGTLQGKTIDVEGKDIVIGMLQSISQMKYNPDIYKEFNFVIYDECHHTSAEKFSQALQLLCTKYQLGLSATPTRKDGLTKVFKWYLGDVIYQVKRKNTETVNVERYICTSTTGYYTEQMNRMGKPCIASMINNVVKYSSRNKLIISVIKKLVKEKRDILVLSERRGHLEELKKLIKDHLNVDSGLYIGGMKNADLELSCEKQIILATYQMASEGFDCKKLNTLVMVTSKSDIVQAVGRILRQPHIEITPLIIDFCDMFSIFGKQSEKRLKFYNKEKYVSKVINVHNCEVQKVVKNVKKLDMTKCLF